MLMGERPAHPRSRGEHSLSSTAGASCCGSSPLARGTPSLRLSRSALWRLIPARAGNTRPSAFSSVSKSAHPRSRGEHLSSAFNAPYWCGSSPLARGTHNTLVPAVKTVRLIPARAGNTFYDRVMEKSVSAHPRSRGEHWSQKQVSWLIAGSSPLARGTLFMRRAHSSRIRLIPARAGNTLADMGFYPLHQQNRITLEPEPDSRIHDKQ